MENDIEQNLEPLKLIDTVCNRKISLFNNKNAINLLFFVNDKELSNNDRVYLYMYIHYIQTKFIKTPLFDNLNFDMSTNYDGSNYTEFLLYLQWKETENISNEDVFNFVLQIMKEKDLKRKKKKPIEQELIKQDINAVQTYNFSLAKFTKSEIYATKKHGFIPEELLLQGSNLALDMGGGRKLEISLLNYTELNDVFHFMTGIDKAVTNAINSEIKAGNYNISIAQIAKIVFACNGTPSEKQIEIVFKSIEKQSGIRLHIDCSSLTNGEEIILNGEKQNPKKIHCNAIESTGITLETQTGVIIEGAYHFSNPPIFSQIAEHLNQFTTISYSLKQKALSEISSTEENINLFELLIERIAHMKYSKSANENFYKVNYNELINNVLACLRKELPANKKTYEKLKTRIKKNAKTILESLKSEKYIKNFEEYKNNQRWAQGITIIL